MGWQAGCDWIGLYGDLCRVDVRWAGVGLVWDVVKGLKGINWVYVSMHNHVSRTNKEDFRPRHLQGERCKRWVG